MAEVVITGMFMNAEIKTSTFDGNQKSNVHLDLYQKDSGSSEKTVSLKTDDLTLINLLNDQYDFGSMITVKARVNAYQNKAYFRLLDIVS